MNLPVLWCCDSFPDIRRFMFCWNEKKLRDLTAIQILIQFLDIFMESDNGCNNSYCNWRTNGLCSLLTTQPSWERPSPCTMSCRLISPFSQIMRLQAPWHSLQHPRHTHTQRETAVHLSPLTETRPPTRSEVMGSSSRPSCGGRCGA